MITTEEIEKAFEYNIKQGERFVVYSNGIEPVLIVVHPMNKPKVVYRSGRIVEIDPFQHVTHT